MARSDAASSCIAVALACTWSRCDSSFAKDVQHMQDLPAYAIAGAGLPASVPRSNTVCVEFDG